MVKKTKTLPPWLKKNVKDEEDLPKKGKGKPMPKGKKAC